jgi:PAS domain S-box-containing protein
LKPNLDLEQRVEPPTAQMHSQQECLVSKLEPLGNLTGLGIAAGLALALRWAGSFLLALRRVRSALTQAWDAECQSAESVPRTSEIRSRRPFEGAQDGILAAIVESSDDAIISKDLNGIIISWNAAAERLFGYRAGEAIGQSINLIIPPDLQTEELILLDRLCHGEPVDHFDTVRIARDGRRIPISLTISPIHGAAGAIIGASKIARDITERKQAEARRVEYDRELRMLSRRLVWAQEAERRNIARELHDEIGQSLTVTELNLQALLALAGNEAMAFRLRESLQVVACVQEQVHDLSLNLRPSMLDDLGLEATLRWYANRQAALVGLPIEVRVDPLEFRLDPVIETECFRIAQEALNNVVKHAEAHTVTVELTRNDEQLHLSVRDDGVGFDVASVREQAVRGISLGLLSMEERAAQAGGGLQYHAIPGQGAEVHAWFPLKRNQPSSSMALTAHSG